MDVAGIVFEGWNVCTKWSEDASMAGAFPAVLPLALGNCRPPAHCPRSTGTGRGQRGSQHRAVPWGSGVCAFSFVSRGASAARVPPADTREVSKEAEAKCSLHGPRCLVRRDVPETQLCVPGRVACPPPGRTVPRAAGAEPGFLPGGQCVRASLQGLSGISFQLNLT